MVAQFAEPSVSVAKFERQIEAFEDLRTEYEARGWFLVESAYPTAYVLVGVPQLRPPTILAGVLFDYTNYDAVPPSVQIVEPFTRVPYAQKDAPTQLNRGLPPQSVAFPGVEGGLQLQGAQPLMQAHAPDDVPFLCVAGTREYHEHPGHSGDSWELHRSSGAGALVRLLEIVSRYGVEPIRGYGVNLVPQIGFEMGPPPP